MERPAKTPVEFLRDAVILEVEDPKSNVQSIAAVYALAIAGIPATAKDAWTAINVAVRDKAKRAGKPDLPYLERVKTAAWKRTEAISGRVAA